MPYKRQRLFSYLNQSPPLVDREEEAQKEAGTGPRSHSKAMAEGEPLSPGLPEPASSHSTFSQIQNHASHGGAERHLPHHCLETARDCYGVLPFSTDHVYTCSVRLCVPAHWAVPGVRQELSAHWLTKSRLSGGLTGGRIHF